jgi:hypothetical protein
MSWFKKLSAIFLTATLDWATIHAVQLLLFHILTAAEMVEVFPVPGGPVFVCYYFSHSSWVCWRLPWAITNGKSSATIAPITLRWDSFKRLLDRWVDAKHTPVFRGFTGDGNHRRRMKGESITLHLPWRTCKTNSSRARSEFVSSSLPTTRTRSTMPDKLPWWSLTVVSFPRACPARPTNSRPSWFVMIMDVCISEKFS